MKYSRQTIEILNNFAKINPALLFRQGTEGVGTKLVSADGSKGFVAHATITEVIPEEFFISNLAKKLSILTLPNMKDSDIEFHGTHLLMKGQKADILLHYQSKSMDKFLKLENGVYVNTPVYNDLPAVVDPIFSSLIPGTVLDNFFKATSILCHQYYTLKIKDGKSYLIGSMNNIETDDGIDSDDYTQELGETTLPDLQVSFPLKYLKIIPGDYKFSVIEFSNSSGKAVRGLVIEHNSIDLKYLAARATR